MIRFKKNYPTILLASDEAAVTEAVRHDLSATGIYCHTYGFNDAKEHLEDADILVVISDEYSSPAVSLLDAASKNGNVSIFYSGTPSDVEGISGVQVIPHTGTPGVSGDSAAIAAELSKLMGEKYKLAPAYAEDDEIVCELTKPAQVYYNGTKLPLSKSEARIVHFLLTVEPRFLVPRETIGEYLSLAPGAVPVHIHNINDKSMKIYHDKLIFSRSSKGYFVY